jgi:hypothetical protein
MYLFEILYAIIIGIIICLYIHHFIKTPTLSNFIEPFIVFGFILFLVIFIYLSLKKFDIVFIKKMPFYFLLELLFVGLFSYFYFIIIYYFRGIPVKKIHIVYLSLLFIFLHILLQLSGTYKTFFRL